MPTYVLTGANRGLGLEFSRQISSSPSNTLFAGVRSLQNDLKDLEALNTNKNIHILPCDVSSLDSIASFASSVSSKLGQDGKVDYILNNAGMNSIPNVSALEPKEADFLLEMRVNVLAPQALTAGLVSHLQKGSVVMNMTSGLASIQYAANGSNKCPVYSISKAALNMLTAQQAMELKPKGVIVVAMDPGWVKTRMGGEGAMLEPHESIGGMLGTIHKLKIDDAAKFYKYSGETVPY